MQTNSGVITAQPSKPVYSQNRSPGDHFYILSVVLSTIYFLCCSWYALCCTIPTMVYAVKVGRYQKVPGSIPRWIPDFSVFLCSNSLIPAYHNNTLHKTCAVNLV